MKNRLIDDRREPMIPFLLVPFLLLTATLAHSADTLKQQASSARPFVPDRAIGSELVTRNV